MTDDLERHAQKMAKKKAARDKIMATKTDKKGLIIVHTGKGKGKHRNNAGIGDPGFCAFGNGTAGAHLDRREHRRGHRIDGDDAVRDSSPLLSHLGKKEER